METRIQYGPYSPQEIERISVWLKQNNINFELIRDDQQAQESLMNDGQNVVSLAEFRTNIYLAQIYYITLIDASVTAKAQFEDRFTLKSEIAPFADFESADDEKWLEQGKLKQQRKKRGWAIFLALYLVVLIVVSLVRLLWKES